MNIMDDTPFQKFLQSMGMELRDCFGKYTEDQVKYRGCQICSKLEECKDVKSTVQKIINQIKTKTNNNEEIPNENLSG